uniref:Uncharacterized protein n=1 Tax=Pan troglodytes TaxID=9598 RepID=G2HE20_PANTR|nr:hypothetical protein [Pan troglodytes]
MCGQVMFHSCSPAGTLLLLGLGLLQFYKQEKGASGWQSIRMGCQRP